jgi:hypothetical protein
LSNGDFKSITFILVFKLNRDFGFIFYRNGFF